MNLVFYVGGVEDYMWAAFKKMFNSEDACFCYLDFAHEKQV